MERNRPQGANAITSFREALMISSQPQAQQVVSLLLAHDIYDVIISPGSRSGALVHTFNGCKKFNCRTVVDERSAAYFAMGLAQAISRPVVLLCSSGTATLNYAPAIAEFYQQGIPIIVLTADRPAYWIAQLENQCINQNDIYRNFIKYSATLPLETTEKSLWFARRQINEAIHSATTGKLGPVHLNIPFEEPLHKTVDTPLPNLAKIALLSTQIALCESEKQIFLETLANSLRILIIVGQLQPDKPFCQSLVDFAKCTGAVILAEPLANIHSTIDNSDVIIWQVDNVCRKLVESGDDASLRPDMLITCGNQVVSKAIKQFLRTYPPSIHYHIGADNSVIDTYQSLTHIVAMSPTDFFVQVLPTLEPVSEQVRHQREDYLEHWQSKQHAVNKQCDAVAENSDFSDWWVYQQLFANIPSDSVIHLGNSSPVRYALMNKPVQGAIYLGNRGTSGIDGSLSTAVGYASASEKINTVILGDLSFLYDSNALWNHYLSNNLRIVVVNNGGGNIFGQLETLSQSPDFKQYFLAEHHVSAQPFAKAFGLDYISASDAETFKQELTTLYATNHNKPILLEVLTDYATNIKTYQQLINNLHEEK